MAVRALQGPWGWLLLCHSGGNIPCRAARHIPPEPCPVLRVSASFPGSVGSSHFILWRVAPASLLVPGCDRRLSSCGDPEPFAVLRSLCLNICTRCGSSKASLTQLGVCPRGRRGLEGVLSNSSPDSAQKLLPILRAAFPCGAGSLWGVRGPGGPGSTAGLSEGIDREGRGRGCWLLHLDPIRDDPVWGQAAVGACSTVLPAQRGALCCLAEPTGLWFLT